MADPINLHPPLKDWVSQHLSKDFGEVIRLTNKESKNDPPEEPFRSLYAARELLTGITARLQTCSEHLKTHQDFKVLSACVQLEQGLNYISAEELGQGERLLKSCLDQLDGLADKVKTASVSVQALNQLGVLWGNRGEQQKALECLLKAKAVYESHVALPPPITSSQWLVCTETSEREREGAFERQHTFTLFYLAQVYGNLKQHKLSAQYCQTTLGRQLEEGDGGEGEYDPIEWSLNCATLSQYYMTEGNYPQARHCLAAASHVLERFRSREFGPSTSDSTGERVPVDGRMEERVRESTADISRCWTKYCLSLLQSSQKRLGELERGVALEKPRHKLFKFDTLDLSDAESAISCELFDTYEKAKPVFLLCQKHIQRSKEHYTLEEFASEHILVVQDHSNAFKLLACFEASSELQCRMHKRRVDMLTALQGELNPQYYLAEHRQIMYEVAETQAEMASLKIVSASDAPTPHAVAKINKLLQSAIQTFERFVASFRDPQTGCLPGSLDEDYVRPVLCSKLNVARLYSKFISPDPASQVSPYH